MTAAEVTGTDGVVSKHWSRTVYLRQGRFFVVSVTVRTAAYPPLRSAYPRVYTTGRFKVREELQWLGVQDKHKQDAAGLCTPCCSGIATVLNLAAACNQAKQLQVQQGVQAVSACSTVHLRGRQQQKLLQEQYSGCAVGQQQQEADTEQQIQPWWSWLFTAARWVAAHVCASGVPREQSTSLQAAARWYHLIAPFAQLSPTPHKSLCQQRELQNMQAV
jgi:hypothetical protein